MPAAEPLRPIPRLILPASLGLCLFSLGLFVTALTLSERGHDPNTPGLTQIRVTETLCDPMELTLPAGRQGFRIFNAAQTRPLEWEILDGVMVVAERENIAPGFSADLAVRLSPGEYQITCGLLSSPRGKLIVTATDQSLAEQKQPPTRAMIGPLSEYKVRMMVDAGRMQKSLTKLSDALVAGDLDNARSQLLEARASWRRIEPLAGRFSDLSERIDPSPRYLAQGVDDPAFTGFHRLEASLWQDRPGGPETAAALVRDSADLVNRIKDYAPAPADIAGHSAQYAAHLADSVIPDGEDAQNGQDGPELAQALASIKASTGLLKPFLSNGHPLLQEQLDGEFSALEAAIAALPADYRTTPAQTRSDLAAGFTRLSALLAEANQAMGLGA
ncbi:imelysin family protein [Paracoccus sp. (in: a-proteobacteria)]|uniref:imelysin family protein n=1 Tax=Paracoccus sp. TaxID=267 RepID=UPI00289DE80C|nr:imelysin family protein [Paracoccus sp. (in: a-proteobacteria)]